MSEIRKASEFEAAAVGNWQAKSSMSLLYPGDKDEAAKEVKMLHHLLVAAAATETRPLTWSAV